MNTKSRRTTESEGRAPARPRRKTAGSGIYSWGPGGSPPGLAQFFFVEKDVLVGDITGIVAGREYLHVIDPGGRKVEFEAIQRVEGVSGKRVGYVFLTHEHNDHAPNAKRFEPLEVLRPSDLARETEREIDGKAYRFLPTPGHCSKGDQSILVDGVLFVGDMVNLVGITPIEDDEDFVRSMEKLAKLDFRKAFSAHGGLLSREEAVSAAKKMAKGVRRARELVRDAAALDDAACRTIYWELTGRADFHPGNPLMKSYLRLFGILALKYR
jgi:glyoxylase-like metal-dependent hydrolase (beta-lactamase superfamily II)